MSPTRTEQDPGERCNSKRRFYALLLLITICSVQLVLIAGCHRGFYRRQADNEARRLITEKLGPRWNSATGDIEIDPMSRMFDPFSADHPPLPPDDPTSHKLMRQVDGKPGYPHWHANGDICDVQSPVWRSYLPVNEEGNVVLSLSDAYQLALIHSPDLQRQRETLYLSALEVSIQRFGFDTQLFAGFNSFYTSRGRFQTGTGASSSTFESSLGASGGGLTARRLGISGANFVVGLANTILWEFSGNNTQSANSLIDFSVIQPLLRGAGRERIMESLTQAERDLLANVRQLERFRRSFYLQIATGRSATAALVSVSNSFLNQPAIVGPNVGGYLGLLQQKQEISNIEFSVAQFESLLKQFRELFEKDRIDSLQVAQFEASVYAQQERLLNARIAYQDSLDRFKVLIGLPPDVNVVIEDPYLDGFKLIDDQFPMRLNSIKELRESVSGSVAEFSAAARDMYEQAVAKELAGEEVAADASGLKSNLDKLLPFLLQTKELVSAIKDDDRARIQKDIEYLGEVRGKRLDYLTQVKKDIDAGRLESQVEPNVFTEESLPTKDELEYQLDDESNQRSLIAKVDEIIAEVDDRISRIKEGENSGLTGSEFYKKLVDDFGKRIPDMLTEIDGIILEMAILQAAARVNVIEITDVKIDSAVAYETARCFRRDWMNARSALVDRWRQIEFFADQLESQVDLVLTGEIGNAGRDNPFRIRYEDGNIRAGFRFDAPIVRQSERNAYRRAQISYQQARRSFYRFEDAINQSLRQTIRNINQDKVLFELNRQNIQVNIKQVQLARANLDRPPRPGQASQLGDVTARNLTGAIQGLTNAQNRYLRLWTEYEVLRRNLDFDMGTMELDATYQWVDPGMIDASIGQRVAAREGIAENERYCCGMQQAQMQFAEEYFESDDMESVVTPPSDESGPVGTVETPNEIEVENAPQVESLLPEPKVIIPPPPTTTPEPKVIPKLDVSLRPIKAKADGVDQEEENQFSVSDLSDEIFQKMSQTQWGGHLDPFRRKTTIKSDRQKLVGVAPNGDPKATGLPEESADTLKRAFTARAEASVAEKPPTRATATIIAR